jgi:hypothetical protein
LHDVEATILAAAITLAESYVKGSGWPYKLTPEPAPADDPFLESETEPSAQTASAMSTGYRVVVPGAIEVSARLSTAQEVRQLIKVLRAGILVFAADADVDTSESFNQRVAAIKAASSQAVVSREHDTDMRLFSACAIIVIAALGSGCWWHHHQTAVVSEPVYPPPLK